MTGGWLWVGSLLWLVGTWLALWGVPPAPEGGWLALTGVAVLAAAWGCWRQQPVVWLWPRRWAVACLCLGTAFCLTTWRIQARMADVLETRWEGVDLQVRGRVVGLPQVDEAGWHFWLEVDHAALADTAQTPLPHWPRRLALHWVKGWNEDPLLAGPPPSLVAGELWLLPVRLKRPHAVLNPNGFDAELWLFEQGIGATGTVRAHAAVWPQILDGPRLTRPLEALAAWRQDIRDRLWLRAGKLAQPGVLAALTVGDQSAIDTPGWDRFRATGVAHLMSISGLHITLFAWLAAAVVTALWRRWPAGMARWPAPVAGLWGGLLLATAYAGLAGWGVPAQRTVWMLALAVGLKTCGLRWPAPLLCLVAGVGVSCADPWALLQAGFWLSFVAVGLLLLSGPTSPPTPTVPPECAAGLAATVRLWAWARRCGHSLREGWRAQWLATVGLAPLTLVLFGQLSVVGLLANLVAVPLITFVVTPLALAGVLVPPLWRLADLVLVPLLAWLDALAAWPGAVWAAPAAPVWAQALTLLAGLLWILPWPRLVRWLAVFWVLPLCFPGVNAPKEGEFELLAFDVGQGSAVLVRTAHHVLLHDTGPRHAAGSDAGRRIVLPELQALGVRRVDTLVLSHRDQDHVGGAASVLAGLPVSQMLVSLEPGHALRQAGPAVQDCRAGQSWMWDGVRFDVLHPQHPVPAGRGPWGAPALKPNAHSCVLRVQDAQGRSALLTGDIEAAQEAELVVRHGAALRSTVLVVPHHGSRTSSTPAFLAAVAPRTAVIQVAYRSHFGHPHPMVLQRYHQRGIDVVRTDHCGAWQWRADAAICTRGVRQHHWRMNFDLPSPGAGSDVARVSFAGERE